MNGEIFFAFKMLLHVPGLGKKLIGLTEHFRKFKHIPVEARLI